MDIGENGAFSITCPMLPSFADRSLKLLFAASAVSSHLNGGGLIGDAGNLNTFLTRSMKDGLFRVVLAGSLLTFGILPSGGNAPFTDGFATLASATWLMLPGFDVEQLSTGIAFCTVGDATFASVT
jgi:hypothetical protein